MSLPYFPMYPTDFEAKTSHLTLAEDGAYNRLLRLMWMTPECSLPDDDAWIMRRMRCTKDEFEAVVRVVIDEFCTRENGRVSNAKLARVFEQSQEAHARRVSAGSKGGKAKSLKTKETATSNAKAKPKQPEPELEPLVKREANASQKRGTRLPDSWQLPRDWGEWAIDEGYPETVIREQAETFKDYWIGLSGQKAVKRDWFATWRNWIRRNGKKLIEGGQNGKPSDRADRLQRTIAAAAAGSSHQDWG